MRRLAQLQVALGVLWVLDALLQLQPELLGPGLAAGIADSAMGQPARIQSALVAFANLVARDPGVASVAIACVQGAIGVAILAPRTRRLGLVASVPWALGVWVLGEGLGGVATGFASLLGGAPGPAVLYAAAAVLVLPARGAGAHAEPGAAAACFGALGERGAAALWGALWATTALLQSVPVVTLGFKLSAGFQMASLGEPSPFASLDRAFGRSSATHGPEITGVLLLLELAAGSAALARGPWRRRLLVASIGVCALCWVVGENAGALLTGSASDPGAMPLYCLIAVSMLESRAGARTGSAPLGGSSSALAPVACLPVACLPVASSPPPRAAARARRRPRAALGRWTAASSTRTEPAPTRSPPAASVG
ncbi:MAG TPA: hypothetical protein VMV02_04675 [Acidimicrobiales bacterium]|nr:hypothetical protein [Acidimicrobiales bacterium]